MTSNQEALGLLRVDGGCVGASGLTASVYSSITQSCDDQDFLHRYGQEGPAVLRCACWSFFWNASPLRRTLRQSRHVLGHGG